MGEFGLAGLCTGPPCISHQAALGCLTCPPLLSSIPILAAESRPHPPQASARSSAEAWGPHIRASEGAWSLDSTRLIFSSEDKL